MNFKWYHKTHNIYHSKIKRIEQIIIKYGPLKTQTANNRMELNEQVTIYLQLYKFREFSLTYTTTISEEFIMNAQSHVLGYLVFYST